jgi:hypothetical protein
MGVLDLEALAAAPVAREPFEFLTTPQFVRAEARPAIARDFPPVGRGGSYPVEVLSFGPAFQELLDELNSAETRAVFESKFGVDLAERATMTTVRSHSTARDGFIHTDSQTKIITVLIYLNEAWDEAGGRLRLLRSADSLDDPLLEVAPEKGTLVAFKRSANSWHGHQPHFGERRVVQFNWVTEAKVVRRELARHRWSAAVKRLMAVPSFR